MAKASQAADLVYKPFETLTKSLSRFKLLLLIMNFLCPAMEMNNSFIIQL